MPDPPPPPPTPGLSPPAGERASEPALLPGRPSLGPGRSETTMPEPPPLPPPPLAGASTEPASSCPPRPVPRAPRPELERPDPTVSDGGGGTTLPALRVPLPLAPPLAPRSGPVPDRGRDGGGGTTEAPGELAFAPPSVDRPAPMAALATEGGGGTMLVAEEL